MAKDESETVKSTEIEVTHDELLGEIGRAIKSESERKSDASESADVRAKFNDKTGMNNQAMGWLGSIVKKLAKKNGQQKAMDVIRALEVGLPMIKDHVGGQGTMEMELPEPSKQVSDPAEQESDDADLSDAYAQGQAAYEEGVTREGNPFGEGDERHEWFDGWDDAADLGDFGDEVDANVDDNVIPMGA